MVPAMHDKIGTYTSNMAEEHHRYRSWEHCFNYFHQNTIEVIARDRDRAALELGFYLASWGMYRGSSFLLQRNYTIHRGAIDVFVSPQFAELRSREFGARNSDSHLSELVLVATNSIREAYRPFAPKSEWRQASDTLVTKIILGTFGCLPACDRYFIQGWRNVGLPYTNLNDLFIERVLRFCRENAMELLEEQTKIERTHKVHYPLMKLADMYFWQIGYQLDQLTRTRSGA
jgi:hypothetical protein